MLAVRSGFARLAPRRVLRALHLTPREADHLQLHQVGALAQKRLARGLRLNQPEVAVDTLLMNASTNEYVPTGYNHPTKSGQLTAYLPGNGGILIAVALMAGGWEGAPPGEAPGFPSDWAVQAEGFTPYF